MPERLYRPVDPHVSFPRLETRVMEEWAEGRLFHRSLERRAGAPEWVFYEGPPTANNKPAIHHAESRVFKDIFCRFNAMRGFYVHRKAGWDCHGLPVEIEVEKELGVTRKQDIEATIGIEEFVRRCRESVLRYVEDWERFTPRLGFWLDLSDAYFTMDRDYIETVWWLLKQIWDKGLMEEDFKVVPYCPRCETSLSSHEQHQPGAYRDVSDPSVYVRFPITGDGFPDTSLLVWTTTPWTLLANLAAAVGPDVTYAVVDDPHRDGRLVMARSRVEALAGDGARVHRELPGSDLIGLEYAPPFDFVPAEGAAHTVRPGDFVTTEDGSGIVHLAPYGEEDMEVAKRDGLPVPQMIDPSGRVSPMGERFAGLWIKDADPEIVTDLDRRGLLFKAEEYRHSYPHCWRCHTPLLYYPRKDWYIRTSQIRDALQASNETTNWQPPTIKHGRFGDWLANNVDWSLSRDRYWGTPLPIWRCERGHATCIGSFAELGEASGRDLGDFDPHRPYVDDITITCPECGDVARRVPAVIDVWFDSGAMPFGQWHYPFENEGEFETRFPADFISEAIDQTRGWFYSLLAIATLVRGENSYRNVVCLGHLVDGEGRKMSKSLGNVIDPWTIFDTHGADALRWYLLTGGTAWVSRRISGELIEESLRRYLLTLWNTYSFWTTYASLESFDASTETIPVSDRPEIDRWILAELNDTVDEVTDSLDVFDATRGGRRLDRFVDDLSNWYVRRSRRRFWRSGADADTRSAFLTLWECLVTVARLSAPYTPFVSDEIYTNLTRAHARPDPLEGSVHLADWPTTDDARIDDGLRSRMETVRKVVGLGRSARTDAKVRVRQPLARALVVVPGEEGDAIATLRGLIAEELNVKEIEVAAGLDALVSYEVRPNFKALGPRLGPNVKKLASALAGMDARPIVEALDRSGTATVDVDGSPIELAATDVEVRITGRHGFSLAQEGPYGVALDLELTAKLVSEGNAREVVRAVQELRKETGLMVEDRIDLYIHAPEDVAAALAPHQHYIATEVLATTVSDAEPPPGAARGTVQVEGGVVEVALEKAAS